MAKKLNSVLGIDIGSRAIKIAELRLQGRQAVITAMGSVPTPDGAVDHIGINDTEAVGGSLKQLCAAAGVSVPDVVVSVAGQGSVLVRTVAVPNMNDAELKQHMDWEISKSIPFAESTVVSDFQALPAKPGDTQNIDVVMAVSPQSAVDGLISIVKKAGKKPHAIDVEPLGLARTLKQNHDAEISGRSVCLVEVGHKTTAINVYVDGHLALPRQVPIGGEMFTRALAENLGISFEEAQDLKHNRASIPESAAADATSNPFDTGFGDATQQFAPYNPFADPSELPAEESLELAPPQPVPPEPAAAPVPAKSEDPETVRLYNAMSQVVEEFVAEVRRSIDYYRSKGGDVDAIMLCGGGSKLKGLDMLLGKSLGLPVSSLDPMRGLVYSAKKTEGVSDGAKQEFAVAVGNCLHILF